MDNIQTTKTFAFPAEVDISQKPKKEREEIIMVYRRVGQRQRYITFCNQ